MNKYTVGQRLAVSTRGPKLVSQKRQTAGLEGYGHRKAFKEKAKEYEDIMTKGKKK